MKKVAPIKILRQSTKTVGQQREEAIQNALVSARIEGIRISRPEFDAARKRFIELRSKR